MGFACCAVQLGINGCKLGLKELEEECNATLISSCRLLYTLSKKEENDELFLTEKVGLHWRLICAHTLDLTIAMHTCRCLSRCWRYWRLRSKRQATQYHGSVRTTKTTASFEIETRTIVFRALHTIYGATYPLFQAYSFDVMILATTILKFTSRNAKNRDWMGSQGAAISTLSSLLGVFSSPKREVGGRACHVIMLEKKGCCVWFVNIFVDVYMHAEFTPTY